jgi:hypothetical protein
MATVMDVQPIESARQPYFSAIRWGALFAGVITGTASYLLLTLFGLAVGLTAVDPTSAEPVGRVPFATGIWTGLSLLISAYIGGYVAGRMSGLSRRTDGMLHGFVSWAATTLLYVFLTTSAVGAILGGTFRVVGEVAQTGAQAAGGSQNILNMIAGGNTNVSAQTLRDIQQAIASGNRDQAVNLITQNLGMTRESASQLVDRVTPLVQQGGGQAREAATRATQVLTGASWWLFIGLALSLALGILGGASGVRPSARRLEGDYTAKRHVRTVAP